MKQVLYVLIVTFVIVTSSIRIEKSYDFIIVGCGSSGSVIVARLSAVSSWNILVLEAGTKGDFITSVPMLVSLLQFSKYNWNYLMEEQPGICLACENNRMPWLKGKGLGGTSLINYMIYSRGNFHSYNRWGEKNKGWSYNQLLSYILKSEDCGLKNFDFDYHGFKGPLSVEYSFQTPITKAFIGGLHELGVPIGDYNANNTLVVGKIQATTIQGRRHSVAKAFIQPIKHRKNLTIITHALVTKILINSNKRAFGVEFDHRLKNYRVEPTKEVIVTGGPINSPQLLMLSGIGQRQGLEKLHIKTKINLPIGQNLQNHITYVGLVFTTPFDVTNTFGKIFNPIRVLKWLKTGEGPLASIGGVQAIGFIKTSESDKLEDIPDMELLFSGVSLTTDYGLFVRKGMGIRDDVFYSTFSPNFFKSSFTIFPMLLSPKSKGFLTLRSKNPRDFPLLYGNYFTDVGNKDLKTFIAAIRFIQKLEKTSAFKKFKATLSKAPFGLCLNFENDSDEYWECCIRYFVQTLHHQTGTVKMGPRTDPGACVDRKLRVYGVKRLRVADCSVIPDALAGHTNVPAIMIGEKASDLLMTKWLKQN